MQWGCTAARVSVETVSRAWFNANQESKYYYVPSLIAVMLFIFSLLLTSIGIVKEKEIGTIEQVMVTPIRKIEFILGKTIPYMVTGYMSMTIMLIVALVVFNVHVKGSLLLLYALSGIYLCGNMGHCPDHQRQRPDPAAGPAHQFPDPHALRHDERVHVSHKEHARRCPVSHLSEPHAMVPGNPEGNRYESTGLCPVARHCRPVRPVNGIYRIRCGTVQ